MQPLSSPQLHRVLVSGERTTELAAEVAGEGQPFLWSHALLGSMAQDLDGGVLAWRDLNDICRVIRFDARGHGRSGTPGEPEDYSWVNQARSLWEVADHFTDHKMILGGASMGSAVSLHAACQRPDRVQGLVLAIPPRAWEWREGKAGGYRVTANVVKYTHGLPFRLLARIPFKRSDSFRNNNRGVMARDLARVRPEGVVGAMRGAALSDFPSREALANLQIPALILAWPDDATHPLAVAEELNRILPNSQLQVASREGDPYAWPDRVREFILSL
jgi:3-oxoadipate enol-lactonase